MIKVKLAEVKPVRDDIKVVMRKNHFDTSYVGENGSIGQLRYPAVGNGRYERRHPILDSNNNRVGALANGVEDLGYTYSVVYIDDMRSFYITHAHFSGYGGGNGFISRVAPSGKFLLPPRETKFTRVDTVGMPDHLEIGVNKAFKVSPDGTSVLHVTGKGFCTVDTRSMTMLSDCKFSDYHSGGDQSISISSNHRVLAIAMNRFIGENPLDGEHIYKCYLQVYSIQSGELLDERDFGENLHPTIQFLAEDQIIAVMYSGEEALYFKLKTS